LLLPLLLLQLLRFLLLLLLLLLLRRRLGLGLGLELSACMQPCMRLCVLMRGSACAHELHKCSTLHRASDVAGVSPVSLQTWQSPDADVARGGPNLGGADVAGVSPVPLQPRPGVNPFPVKSWRG
jgi:hypothetical protein